MNLLLVHGWGANNSIWKGLATELSGANTVLTPCLYDAVAKIKNPSFFSMARFLDHALTKDCVVIAWSMGGLVAMYLSGMSKKVRAIVFVASAPAFINKEGWPNVIDSTAFESLYQKLSLNPTAAITMFSGLIAHGDNKTMLTSLHNCMAGKNQVQILSCWLEQLKEIDLRKQFASLEVPVLVLLGERDALIKPGIKNQLIALNKRIECHVLKGCGHAPFISKKEETKKIIERFLHARFGQ